MADYTNESPDQSMTVTDSGGGITSMVSTTLGPQSTTSDWFDPSPNIVTLTRGGTLVPISNQISNLTQTEIDNTNNVPYFDLGETSNLILKSLENGLTYQHGNSTVTIGPAELDLNGANGPIFDLGKESTLQQDSLLSIPRENNNFSYADLDGKDGGNGYFNDTPSPGKGRGKQIDQKDLHVHLLEKNYYFLLG